MDDILLAENIEKLRLYLTYLPQTLPFPSANNSIYGFENFVLDQDWVEDAGEEAAVNRELEVRLGSRANGPIHLKERGTSIAALANVLERYLLRYPKSAILQEWVSDILASAQSAFEHAKVEVS